jgi:hypothetical protein
MDEIYQRDNIFNLEHKTLQDILKFLKHNNN